MIRPVVYGFVWAVTAAFTFGSAWLLAWFGTIRTEQFLSHLLSIADGAASVDFAILVTGVISWLAAPLFIGGVVAIFLFRSSRSTQVPKLWFFSRHRVPSSLNIVLLPALALSGFAVVIDVPGFFRELRPSTFITDKYVAPEAVIKTDDPLNLVLIYVEGLEEGHGTLLESDGTRLSAIAPLTEATASWARPDNFVQAPGTDWTIASIVATQCGIPYRPISWFDFGQPGGRIDGNSAGENSARFLPGIECLGDILSANGYRNVFLGGARKSFAGKGNFLSEHGYETVFGWQDWLRIGEEGSSWGLHDDRLFEYARDQWALLESTGKPYNLTLLTLDTHHPSGLLSDSCDPSGQDLKLVAIFECSTGELVSFLDWGEQQGFLDGTTRVVITGDHLEMPGDLSPHLDRGAQRQVFLRINDESHESWNLTRKFYHFDLFPTILDSLGFSLSQNQAGIGQSLFAPAASSHFSNTINYGEKLRQADPIYKAFWLKP